MKSVVTRENVSEDQIIDNLQELGFTLNDARVFLALLQKGESTPAELAEYCGVDRARVYDSLKRLTAQHYIEQESTKSRPKYWAVNPMTVFENVQKKLSEKIKISQSLLPYLLERFRTPEISHNKYWNVEGKIKIKSVIKSIIENAKTKLTLIITSDFLTEEETPWILNALVQKILTFKGKKSNIQIILPISTLEMPERIVPVLNDLVAQGAIIFDYSSKIMPFGLYLNEKSFLFIPASEFGTMPIYESGIWIEDAKASKLRGFSHLADWFLLFTREGLLSIWNQKSNKSKGVI